MQIYQKITVDREIDMINNVRKVLGGMKVFSC